MCPGNGPSKCHLAGLPHWRCRLYHFCHQWQDPPSHHHRWKTLASLYVGCPSPSLQLIGYPKLLYTIRSSPSFLSPSLQRYDETLRSIVSDITNINLGNTTWTQVLLLAKSGGLGIRRSVQLAPFAFLALAAANYDLTHLILPPRFQFRVALRWRIHQGVVNGSRSTPLSGPASYCQKAWNAPNVSAMADTLLKQALDAVPRSWQPQWKSLVHGWMPFLLHHCDCTWTTTPFASQLAFAYDHPLLPPHL